MKSKKKYFNNENYANFKITKFNSLSQVNRYKYLKLINLSTKQGDDNKDEF